MKNKKENINKRIRSDYMDGWLDNKGGVMLSDERAHIEEREHPFDANSITDDFFDILEDVPVLDKYEREIGVKSVPKRKRKFYH